jgi:hypothetical protein
VLRYEGETYRLIFLDDRPFVRVYSDSVDRIVDLFVLSSVHPLEGRDDTTGIEDWKVSQSGKETIFKLRATSSAWSAKEYRFRCSPKRFVYEIEVEGNGLLAEANYFGGYYSGQMRWGSGFFWSGQAFNFGFNPEPNSQGKIYFKLDGNARIDLMGVPLPARGDWFFTPPPFCFAMAYDVGWIGMGVEAQQGDNRFTEYSYHGASDAFFLSLAYEGYTRVQGRAVLPAIGFDFSKDAYDVLSVYVQALKEKKLVPEGYLPEKPDWWQSPIFCGWGVQNHLARQTNGAAADFSRQNHYEDFLKILEKNNCNPGIVVLDDKWQSTYGRNEVDAEKWPDLRGFIDQQHGLGRKVLLWLKAWDPEGLPVDECITNASGRVVAFDPTNPKCERRLIESVQHMLGIDGYNADGFKVDFTARIPSGPGMHLFGDVWGLELMKAYLEILYREAKRIREDALIISHTPNPYLADVIDMIRLNDINTASPVNPAMVHRAKVAGIACPNALIDTDNWPMPDKASWRNYLYLQSELGVPSLYYASHIDATGEALDAEDYALIRKIWKQADPVSQEKKS